MTEDVECGYDLPPLSVIAVLIITFFLGILVGVVAQLGKYPNYETINQMALCMEDETMQGCVIEKTVHGFEVIGTPYEGSK